PTGQTRNPAPKPRKVAAKPRPAAKMRERRARAARRSDAKRQSKPARNSKAAHKSHATSPDPGPPALSPRRAQAPDGPGWLHEVKFDGYRVQARLDHGKV